MNESLITVRASLRGLALLAALAVLPGCQSGGTRPDGAASASLAAPATSEELVTARANERWQLLIAEEFAKAYDYLSPGYRDVVEFEEYEKQMQSRQIRWTEAQVTDVECGSGKCNVRIQMDYVVRVPTFGVGEVPVTTTLTETWLASDGGWYFLPDRI